ncbi:hypothetical protein [Goodfellowiella coeruleoviolacea]|uniref:Uncharacterized protein n=1 Tax=Goodfellowiella coeruleoviolacea TaxID=334858 RepID=A0AAE3KJ75_9PSEU|nr:hypothetical protein [Goodfellowiella coeruleoviolacea]MCP2168139.1 hypothetical protein [Goodfellowiella coeruleoviolacea]
MAAPANTYAPFDSGPGSSVTADTWRKFMTGLASAGVLQDVAGELEVYADSSGMQVKVRAGQAWIRGHWGEWTTESTLQIQPPTPGETLPRTDRVIVRADFLRELLELDVLQGVPGGGVPPVTQDNAKWEIPVALVPVAPDATTISTVTDDRRYAGQKPVVHRLRAVNQAIPVPTTDGDLLALSFTPHGDCHANVSMTVVVQAHQGASGQLAEPSTAMLGLKLRRASDGVDVAFGDKIFPAEVIDWNTRGVRGHGSTTMTLCPDVTLSRHEKYQVVLFGARTSVLGCNVVHLLGTVTECSQVQDA